MTLTNHYLAGVAAGVLFKNPLIVMPIAFASHFVLDSLPHYGIALNQKGRGDKIIKVSIIDVLIFSIAITLTLFNYPNWYILAGLVAYSPDLAWLYRFIFKENFGKIPPGPANKFNNWHEHIQKYERWWGVFVEISLASFLFFVLFVF